MKNFKELLEKVYQQNQNRIDFSKCQNLNLALNKLIKNEIIERGGRVKSNFLNHFSNWRFKFFPNDLRSTKENLEKQGYKLILDKSFKTQSRLVIGLGSSHVLETSLTLHHIYGIPYIPGSALKGVCRSVAFWKLAEEKNILNDQKQLEELQKDFYGKLSNDKDILTYQLLFGAQNFKGLLLFLDAYPEINQNENIFELDIMNVHYQSYYAGKGEPGDWENPVPIYFLTVKPGIKFNICVLFDSYRWDKVKDKEPYSKVKDKVENLIKSQSQQENIEQLIQEALNEFGIGAKTRLGYGILI